MVRLAFRDNIISEDFTKDVEPIKWDHNTQKEYLNIDEILMLEHVSYEKHPQIPLASLFSIHTGLRRSDILDLKWEHFVTRGDRVYIEKIIAKTGVFVRFPLSNEALRVIGEIEEEGTVFDKLTESILNTHVKKWLDKAGIIKHITFHCFRHSFAMMLTENGVPINIISVLLGHKQVSSTQVYSKVTRQMTENAIDMTNKETEKSKKKLNYK